MTLLFSRKRSAFRRRKVTRGIGRHLVLGGIALIGVGVLGYVLWYVTRLPFFTITEVAVDGGVTISEEVIKEAVTKELEGTHRLFIPKRFFYLYPQEKIVERISGIPRVASVVVSLTSKQELHVEFTEYIPYALWCGDVASACVFLEEGGYAFARAPELKGSAFIRYVTEGKKPEEHVQLFEAARMRTVEAFIEALSAELGFRVDQVTITSDDDVIYHLSGGGRIMVAGITSVQEAFDNLHSVLQSEAFTHLQPGTFEYIDLRFGSRVFVKEEATVEEGEDASSTPALPREE